MNIPRATVSFVFASAMATAVAVALSLAHRPDDWSRLGRLVDIAVLDGGFYVLPPAIVLALIALRRPPSTAIALAVAVGWLALLFTMRARQSILSYGEFPWWMFRRDFLEVLPVPLALGGAFAFWGRLATRSKVSGVA